MKRMFVLAFDGYYTEEDLPAEGHECSGVYLVYRGNENEQTELIYIGRSKDIANRPSPNHQSYQKWRKELKDGEILYFSFANTEDEARAEAALIYRVKPVCNCTGKDAFHHDETTVYTSGENFGLEDSFIVQAD